VALPNQPGRPSHHHVPAAPPRGQRASFSETMQTLTCIQRAHERISRPFQSAATQAMRQVRLCLFVWLRSASWRVPAPRQLSTVGDRPANCACAHHALDPSRRARAGCNNHGGRCLSVHPPTMRAQKQRTPSNECDCIGAFESCRIHQHLSNVTLVIYISGINSCWPWWNTLNSTIEGSPLGSYTGAR